MLYGHHFAAIAGAGPLVGPVLAAQMGYLPGTLWILAGVVFAGAVQDMTVLFLSTRRDGKSLGEMVRSEMGPVAGAVAGIGVLLICVILLAVLALVVVKALTGSPWGAFTVFCTVPIAFIMGVYCRFIRPGRIGEMSLLGAALLLAALIYGRTVSETPELAAVLQLIVDDAGVHHHRLRLRRLGPAGLAVPRAARLSLDLPQDRHHRAARDRGHRRAAGVADAGDHKIRGRHRPGLGGRPVPVPVHHHRLRRGIWLACSIASGTSPKMIENENQIAFIGYGGMLMEAFVAIMAMIGAAAIHPGVYFAMNSSAGLIGATADHAAQVISAWGFTVTPDMLTQMAHDVGENSILSRTGGAPTLAVGMASILSSFLGGGALMGVWYHFIILFEALFILTTVDAGTRVLRFMIQDYVGAVVPAFKETKSWANNLIGSAVACVLWGYLLYAGVVDPYGGIWTLWPLFGATNQMLAAMALILCTVILFKMKRQRYALVTLAPSLWLVICTVTAGLEKVFSSDPAIGFLSHAAKFGAAAAAGKILAPAKTLGQMGQVVFNDWLDAGLAAASTAIVILMSIYAIIEIRKALGARRQHGARDWRRPAGGRRG